MAQITKKSTKSQNSPNQTELIGVEKTMEKCSKVPQKEMRLYDFHRHTHAFQLPVTSDSRLVKTKLYPPRFGRFFLKKLNSEDVKKYIASIVYLLIFG
ncbi:unnamed protein product, partial [Mesorhabditis spiculigera]